MLCEKCGKPILFSEDANRWICKECKGESNGKISKDTISK